jgi:hypothetical protein
MAPLEKKTPRQAEYGLHECTHAPRWVVETATGRVVRAACPACVAAQEGETDELAVATAGVLPAERRTR